MNRTGAKTRDFQWWSHKNEAMVRVHSKPARDYGRYLEGHPSVERYEAGAVLEMERLPHVSRAGIRKAYFEVEWCSDFRIQFSDGHIGVRELASAASLEKLAVVEKLELSRRYWAAMDISDWKVVLAP